MDKELGNMYVYVYILITNIHIYRIYQSVCRYRQLDVIDEWID